MIYGGGNTIHQTQDVNIERDPRTGAVLAVWFRCMMLPFTDRIVDPARAQSLRELSATSKQHGVVGIVFSDEYYDPPAPQEGL